MKSFFKAFGLNIQSEFPFQGIKIPEKGFFDISVNNDSIPASLKNIKYQGIAYESNDNQFLLTVPNVARFLIENGNKVSIEIDPVAKMHEVELFFMGSAMAVILMQRGIAPFHGSAFEKDGKCIIISGLSGAGKSSLLRFFITQGYKALTDDVCALSIKDNKIVISPSYPSSKIWADVMQAFNLEKTKYQQIRPNIEKYQLSFLDSFCSEVLEVDSIYILRNKNIEEFSIAEIKGFEKVKELKANLYRPKFPEATNKEKETFIILNQLANQAKLFELTRSTSIDLLNDFNEYAKKKIIEQF